LVQELIPIGSGLLLGAGLGFVRPTIRLPVGVVLSIVLGVLATVVTGEFKTSWSYLLIDIPLVAIAAILGLVAGRRVRPAASRI
jgi:hypothetical protein